MASETTRKRILELREQLEQHNYNYYVLNQPTIGDEAFDHLMSELIALEKDVPDLYDPNSPSQRVGSDINQQFTQVRHTYPMLSLSNTYSESEVEEFDQRARKLVDEPFTYVCELKFDGTSISLTYENGQLVRAVTRGDGVQGDDVTANVKTIRSVPLKLKGDFPEKFEIRGEVLMPFAVFEQLNDTRNKAGEPLFANPRNVASGSLKMQNSSEVANRKLDAVFYYVLGENLPWDGHLEMLEKAKEWGFKISEHTRACKNVEEIIDFLHYWDEERKNLPVATDGVVIKVNSRRIQEEMGYTAKSPRWAIAYKYKAEQLATRLKSVTYQVGRTGAVTPVANLEPILLAGTIVKRASLHNADIIANLDLHLDDQVFVEKGGEIIPKIVGVDTNARKPDAAKVEFITNCPECNTTLERTEGEAAYYCPNENGCPPQLKGKIEHFCSRGAMDIEGLGKETIRLFFDKGLLTDVGSIYALPEKRDIILGMNSFQEKSVENLVNGIENSKKQPFEKVLFGLGIRFIGETAARKITRAFRSIEELEMASLDELIAVDEIGEKMAQSILNYFDDEKNRILIGQLRKAGLNMESDQGAVPASEKLKGLIFVISGNFGTSERRKELGELVEQNGGKNAGSITGKTNYLLAGDKMGPSKREKAEKLKIPIISEDDFLRMIEE